MEAVIGATAAPGMAGGGPERTFISTGQDITDSVDLGFAVAAVPRQHHRPPSFTGVDDTPSVISVQMGPRCT